MDMNIHMCMQMHTRVCICTVRMYNLKQRYPVSRILHERCIRYDIYNVHNVHNVYFACIKQIMCILRYLYVLYIT